MKIKVCEKCKNFYQHYIYSQKFGFSKIDCGHCNKKLMKKKDCRCFKESHENYEKEMAIMQYFHIYDKKINELSYNLGVLINSIKVLKTEIKNIFNQ